MKKINYVVLILSCIAILFGCSKQEEVEVKAYVLSHVYVDAQELIEEYKDKKCCEDIYLNEDGSLTLVLTETQRKKMTDTDEIEQVVSMMKMHSVYISYSEDYTEINVTAPVEVARAASPIVSSFVWKAELIQVLIGIEDWHVKVIVKDSETGITWQEVTLPEENLDWSFWEDVD